MGGVALSIAQSNSFIEPGERAAGFGFDSLDAVSRCRPLTFGRGPLPAPVREVSAFLLCFLFAIGAMAEETRSARFTLDSGLEVLLEADEGVPLHVRELHFVQP